MLDPLDRELLLTTVSRQKWEKIGLRKRAGVLVPLFSVYSSQSIGIGDLEDLKLLVDWCSRTGNTLIQLLPMNEVGGLFCPYDSLSSFALEPSYLSLPAIPGTDAAPIKVEIEKLRRAFPTGRGHVDYRIKSEKLRVLWSLYERSDLLSSSPFHAFREQNHYWIEDFALFKVLKDHHWGKAWYDWDEGFRNRDPGQLASFKREHEKLIIFQMWLQWQISVQFQSVRAYAEKNGVLLKGDLPILVSRDSADVWAHPECFKLDFAAGAPPDMYRAKGQRWGMPTYDWERIASDGYAYLKAKLRYAQNFYHVLRIDHVVGLFRLWSIPITEPMENQGLNGFFDPRDEKLWEDHGRRILSAILDSSSMLLCAEDLGVVPVVCPKVLKEYGIPGNDVQRWVKDWDNRHDFRTSDEYRLLSVAILSTHDTTNWPAWWENEAGTVDEALFIRKCGEFGVGYDGVKDHLFDFHRSGRGRLRWLDSIDFLERFLSVMGRKRDDIWFLADMYQNTYHEKEKLWTQLGLDGPMRERSDREIVAAVLKSTLDSRAIFCVQFLLDWLFLADLISGDPYPYRINVPGTMGENNWSLRLPISLDELLKHPVSKEVRAMIVASGR